MLVFRCLIARQALELLGLQFDDIYELSSFDIVDGDDVQQQDW